MAHNLQVTIPENRLLYQSDLNLINIRTVTYGKSNRLIDVTNIFKNHFSLGNHSIPVENAYFSDPARGIIKELRVNLTDNSLLIYPEHSIVQLSQISANFNPIKIAYISSAMYGKYSRWIDVTTIIKNHFNRGYPMIKVSNTPFTDPYYGVLKELRLTLVNGTILIYPEHSYLKLETLSI